MMFIMIRVLELLELIIDYHLLELVYHGDLQVLKLRMLFGLHKMDGILIVDY